MAAIFSGFGGILGFGDSMSLKVYNTLSRSVEGFVPLKKGEVGMYVCGPTVYGPGHIGHARTYTAFDIIRRYLEYKGFKVKYVVNITDVHDDLIRRADEDGTTIFSLAEKNISLFMKDLDALGIKRPSVMPRVTGHMKEILEVIEALEKKGFAYETEDGVYFSVSKFPEYGKLSGIKPKKRMTGTRVETDKYEKGDAADFALWKKAREGEPSWPSRWGDGRPGWHIECSAMSTKYLGNKFDIHGGAVDLVFPHHENEIAQSECAFGEKPFVKYWLHAGFLNVAGEKMSKSLGNFITIPQLLGKFDPKAFRFFIAGLHYRSRVDFRDEYIVNAAKGLAKWNAMIQGLLDADGKDNGDEVKTAISGARHGFEKCMDEDFNLPNAWAELNGFQSKINSILAAGGPSKADAQEAIAFMKELNSVFGFFEFGKKAEEKAPKEIRDLIAEREKSRKEKDFAEADRIRQELRQKGFELLDTPQGVKFKKT
ncbi:Cysteine--tRNA ligase [uncultured archaeon]|nr:Cysteine--tRNA ligase [uncultured archaeon]